MILLSATFTAGFVKPTIDYFVEQLGIDQEVAIAPYNQIFQQLVDPHSLMRQNRDGINILLIRIEDLANHSLIQKNFALLEANIIDLIHSIKAYYNATGNSLFLCLCPPSTKILNNPEIYNKLEEMNALINEELASINNLHIITAEEINYYYPVTHYYDEQTDAIGHIPYTQEYFIALGTMLSRKMYTTTHRPFKVIVLDCDETLWKGICSEDDLESIEINFAYRTLQQFMLQQYKSGKLLCLCSKNNEIDVINVFKKHNDMLLKLNHIIASRINFNSKSENIKSLASELNLDLNSFIVIDDNPVECQEIQFNCPETLCITLPTEKNDIPEFLKHIWAFDNIKLTDEDRNRSLLYQRNIERDKLEEKITSISDFIKNLQLRITITPLQKEHIQRVAQLTQRVNQFNFTSIRLSESQLLKQLTTHIHCLVVHAEDRFGDYGLIGAVFYNITEHAIEIDNFLLSCRALGKGIEHKILNHVGNIALENNISKIRITFISSEKNQPAFNFLDHLTQCTALKTDDKTFFVLDSKHAKKIKYTPKKSSKNITPNANTHSNEIKYANLKFIQLAQLYRNVCDIQRHVYPIKTIETKNSKKIVHHNELHQTLIQIWEEVLNISPISIEDNFFDLGGNSLLATVIISQFWKKSKINISLSDFLQFNTISKIVDKINQTDNTTNEFDIVKPLPKKMRHTMLPLSYAQQRLWFLQQANPESSAYNMFVSYQLTGNLQIVSLQKTLKSLVSRHESLRTQFMQIDGVPQQVVIAEDMIDFSIHIEDASKLTEQELYELAKWEASKPIDLEKAPLMRVRLLKTSSHAYILLICMHHIISDGWSFNIISKEINHLYESYLLNQEISLKAPPLQYIDYAVSQKQWLENGIMQKQLTYWTQQLAHTPDLLLPHDYPHQNTTDFKGHRILFNIDSETTSKLKEISKHANTTLYTTLITAFVILLSRYSNQEDLAIGSPVAGRNYPGTENIVGFFVNLIILRLKLANNPSFIDLLQQVKNVIVESYANQDLPFEKLIDIIQPARGSSNTPFVHAMFALQNFPLQPILLPHVKIQPVFTENHSLLLADFDSAKFDLSMYVQENSHALQGLVEYNLSLFKEEKIQHFIEHFKTILKSITESVHQRVSQLNILNHAELNQVINIWNNTTSIYPHDKTIQEIFESQAALTPDHIAISYNNKSITYQQLNSQANQLANYLIKHGVQHETPVSVYIKHNITLVICLLGVLKAGGVYVPVSPHSPPERVKEILCNCQARIVLTQKTLSNKIKLITQPFLNLKIIALDVVAPLIKQEKNTNINIHLKSNNLAYMIYTSGTTGVPKGISLEHRTITNLILWQSPQKKTSLVKKVAQFAAMGFDVSLQEIFFALFNGYELCIVPSEIKNIFSRFIDMVEKKQINYLFLPTATLDIFSCEALLKKPNLNSVEEIIIAGEQLHLTDTIRSFFSHYESIKLINQYGPSETHVVTSYSFNSKPTTWNTLPPIGKPIANTYIYILDKNLNPTPIGLTGEIYIGGAGIARGYLNDPESNREKFLVNMIDNTKNSLLYKTGDTGRWLPDGNIQYVGRLDNQIKIRGYRIEPGEIEIRLSKHPKIDHAYVTVTEHKHLIAHVIAKKHTKLDNGQELTNYLSQYLPKYMMPDCFILHDKLPLNDNGKVDKKYLNSAKTGTQLPKNTHIEPITSTQSILRKVYSSILNIEEHKISINNNFFDIGGNSLLIIKLISQIQAHLDVKLYVQNIFACSSIIELSALIDKKIADNTNQLLVENER